MNYTTILSIFFLLPMLAISGEITGVRNSLHFDSSSFWVMMTQVFSLVHFAVDLVLFCCGCVL